MEPVVNLIPTKWQRRDKNYDSLDKGYSACHFYTPSNSAEVENGSHDSHYKKYSPNLIDKITSLKYFLCSDNNSKEIT